MFFKKIIEPINIGLKHFAQQIASSCSNRVVVAVTVNARFHTVVLA